MNPLKKENLWWLDITSVQENKEIDRSEIRMFSKNQLQSMPLLQNFIRINAINATSFSVSMSPRFPS